MLVASTPPLSCHRSEQITKASLTGDRNAACSDRSTRAAAFLKCAAGQCSAIAPPSPIRPHRSRDKVVFHKASCNALLCIARVRERLQVHFRASPTDQRHGRSVGS